MKYSQECKWAKEFSHVPENHNIVKTGIVPVETKTFSYENGGTEEKIWPSKMYLQVNKCAVFQL